MSAKSETEPSSLLDIIEPWIPRDLLEKLILNAAGVGLVMIAAGAFLKQTHVPARVVSDPGGYDPRFPDRSTYAPTTRLIPESSGLDLLIWTVTLPVSVRDAESFWNFLKGAVTSVPGAFNAVSPFSGLLGQLVGGLMPSFDTSAAPSGEPFTIKVYMSDVLVLAGAGLTAGGALSQVLPKL